MQFPCTRRGDTSTGELGRKAEAEDDSVTQTCAEGDGTHNRIILRGLQSSLPAVVPTVVLR